ncbi:hypothetical protein [Flavobacterium poyangense]|uniref:hypothetical protein n=1 Tax=Flavobacterium poyangense TaxID=2204302 RepID=UPI0014210C29|nr:hypothetical protein [Flavobacterium sp. JXAS1]
MKKLLFLLSALMVILTSCSNDDNSNAAPEDNFILPKEENGISMYSSKWKTTFTYSGNKIVSMVGDNSKSLYTYEGNTIVNEVRFSVDFNGKEKKVFEILYAYEKGKLKSSTWRGEFTPDYPQGKVNVKTVYTPTSDNVYTYVDYSTNEDTKIVTKIAEGILTYKDGNLIRSEHFRLILNTGTIITEIYTFEYDTKNNPFKNILGYSLILSKYGQFSRNNIIRTTVWNPEHSGSVIVPTKYAYDDKGYAISKTEGFSGAGSPSLYVKYTY